MNSGGRDRGTSPHRRPLRALLSRPHPSTRHRLRVRSEAEAGLVSRAGLLGIVICLLLMGGLGVLCRHLWPGLATPWLALIAFAGTCLVLLLFILLLPDRRTPEHGTDVAAKRTIEDEEPES